MLFWELEERFTDRASFELFNEGWFERRMGGWHVSREVSTVVLRKREHGACCGWSEGV